MQLYPGESPETDWSLMAIADLAEGIRVEASGPVTVIAIDGRSGGGKTTLARGLARELNAALLSTDDFAWWHSLFDWTQMLLENAVAPLRLGLPVEYTPDAWTERGRPGCISARASEFVVIEGVGALQTAMREQVDVAIWVQSDAEEAKRRGLIRDLDERPDPAEAERFWNEWQTAENEFQQAQKSWAIADWWVCGTPDSLGLENAGEGFLAAAKHRKTAS